MIILKISQASARFLYPPGEARPTNAFPVVFDTLTIGTPTAGMTLASWQARFFPGQNDAVIIGPAADP